MWQLALHEVSEVQLFGGEGWWVCRAVVWMPPPVPDSLGGVLFPPRQPFTGSTGLLRSLKALPKLMQDTLPPNPPPCPYSNLLLQGRKWAGRGTEWLCICIFFHLSLPFSLRHISWHCTSTAQLCTLKVHKLWVFSATKKAFLAVAVYGDGFGHCYIYKVRGYNTHSGQRYFIRADWTQWAGASWLAC